MKSLFKMSNETLWAFVFVIIGISILDALYCIKYEVMKGRVILFEKKRGLDGAGDVIVGDFKAVDTVPISEENGKPKPIRARNPRRTKGGDPPLSSSVTEDFPV